MVSGCTAEATGEWVGNKKLPWAAGRASSRQDGEPHWPGGSVQVGPQSCNHIYKEKDLQRQWQKPNKK